MLTLICVTLSSLTFILLFVSIVLCYVMLTYFYAPFSLLLKFVYVTSAAYFYGIFFVYFSVVFSLISVVTDMNAFLRSEHLEIGRAHV